MFRPCSVCMHAQRFHIDWWLAQPVISVTGIAREYGVSRYSLQSHREHHVPSCLARVRGWDDTGRLTGHRAKVGELYLNALGALAAAERGALTAGTNDDHPAPAVSMTAIARKIREARTGLDQLMRLAAEAAEHADRPQDLADAAALSARLREQWEQLANRPMQSERLQ